MAKTTQLPWYLSLGNKVTTSLLRAGFKLVGPGIVVGSYPMYLLTVRGRKSGLPRTTPIAIIERNGRRYVSTPYGVVDWVRNLRAAGEATLTRGHQTESVSAVEQSPDEAALIMREEVRRGNPFARAYGVAADAPLEEYERAALIHPLFQLVQLERVA